MAANGGGPAPRVRCGGCRPPSCTLRRYVHPPPRADSLPDLPSLDPAGGLLHPVRDGDPGVRSRAAAGPRPRRAAGSDSGPPPRRRRIPARRAGRRGWGGALPLPALPAGAGGRAGALGDGCGRGHATRRQHAARVRRPTGCATTCVTTTGRASGGCGPSATREDLQTATPSRGASGQVRSRASCRAASAG